MMAGSSQFLLWTLGTRSSGSSTSLPGILGSGVHVTWSSNTPTALVTAWGRMIPEWWERVRCVTEWVGPVSVPSSPRCTRYLLRGCSTSGVWICVALSHPKTKRGNTYAMVCIGQFSKWIEVIPIPNKEADTVAFSFLHNVLGRYGGCAEVITDRGTEFQGSF